VQPYTSLSWCATPGGGYRLDLPEREHVVIQPNLITADEQMGLQVGSMLLVTETGVEWLSKQCR